MSLGSHSLACPTPSFTRIAGMVFASPPRWQSPMRSKARLLYVFYNSSHQLVIILHRRLATARASTSPQHRLFTAVRLRPDRTGLKPEANRTGPKLRCWATPATTTLRRPASRRHPSTACSRRCGPGLTASGLKIRCWATPYHHQFTTAHDASTPPQHRLFTAVRLLIVSPE